MRYDENTPQASDIPRDNQDEFVLNFETLNDFYGIDHIPLSRSVENATRANPCVITNTNHGLAGTEMVTIENLKGLDGEGDTVYWSINENTYAISVLTDDTFELTGANTTNEQEYIESSGNYQIDTSNYYGTHKKVTLATPLIDDPNRSSPKSSLYTKDSVKYIPLVGPEYKRTGNAIEAFFQNSTSGAFQLTAATLSVEEVEWVVSVSPSIKSKTFLYGFTSPWGIKINFGYNVAFGNPTITSTRTFTLPATYSSVHYFTHVTQLNSPGQPKETMVVSNTGLSSFAITLADFSGGADRLFSFWSMGK